MHVFNITSWPDKESYTIEITNKCCNDLIYASKQNLNDLLKCIISILENNNECTHTYAHKIYKHTDNLYSIVLSITDTYAKSYTISKYKLAELKIALMGALNG